MTENKSIDQKDNMEVTESAQTETSVTSDFAKLFMTKEVFQQCMSAAMDAAFTMKQAQGVTQEQFQELAMDTDNALYTELVEPLMAFASDILEIAYDRVKGEVNMFEESKSLLNKLAIVQSIPNGGFDPSKLPRNSRNR